MLFLYNIKRFKGEQRGPHGILEERQQHEHGQVHDRQETLVDILRLEIGIVSVFQTSLPSQTSLKHCVLDRSATALTAYFRPFFQTPFEPQPQQSNIRKSILVQNWSFEPFLKRIHGLFRKIERIWTHTQFPLSLLFPVYLSATTVLLYIPVIFFFFYLCLGFEPGIQSVAVRRASHSAKWKLQLTGKMSYIYVTVSLLEQYFSRV